MKIPTISWPKNIADATNMQNQLRVRSRLENDFAPIKTIAGIDVSYDLKTNLTRAFIVLLDYETLHLKTSVRAQLPTDFPYIPGFLSFREIPTILEALKLLPEEPQMLMVDGQGIAHPRRLGIAAHLGAFLDFPTVGVAKSKLTGSYHEPGPHKGDISPLLEYKTKEQIGTVLRSKDKTNSLFISPGHRVDQQTALNITLHCLTKYRLPEPTRLADKLSKEKNATGTLL
jgi:deoxyribonuclease V